MDSQPDVAKWCCRAAASGAVAGNIKASGGWRHSTGRDADWVVKLINILPDRAFRRWPWADTSSWSRPWRARARRSFSEPEPLAPNTPLEFTVRLHRRATGHG